MFQYFQIIVSFFLIPVKYYIFNYIYYVLKNQFEQQIEENKTVIMVTHDIETGFFQADNLLIMDKGKIVYNRQKSSINIDDFRKEYMSVLGVEAVV